LVQERVGNILELIGIGTNFLSGTTAAQQLTDGIGKWDFIKLKSFRSTKEMVSKLKRTPTESEKIFASTFPSKILGRMKPISVIEAETCLILFAFLECHIHLVIKGHGLRIMLHNLCLLWHISLILLCTYMIILLC
jgi:hypothetical protein